MYRDFLEVRQAPGDGWMVIGANGDRSDAFLSKVDAVDHAMVQARVVGELMGHSVRIDVASWRNWL